MFYELLEDGGLRCQEALSMDINWSDRSILIHGKGAHPHEMFFSRQISTLLVKYLLTRSTPTSGLLFVTHRKARFLRRADLTIE